MSVVLGFSAIDGLHLSHGEHIGLVAAVAIYLAQCFIAAGGFALNDVLDRGRDADIPIKPVVSGRISVRTAAIVSAVLLSSGLALALLLSARLAVFATAQVILVASYSRLKLSSATMANVVTAALCASGFLFGCVFSKGIGNAWLAFMLTFGLVLARELVKDTLDIESDRPAGLRTVPIIYGLTRTHYAAQFLITSTIISGFIAVELAGFRSTSGVLVMLPLVALLITLARFPLFVAGRATEHASLFLRVSAVGFAIGLIGLWHLG